MRQSMLLVIVPAGQSGTTRSGNGHREASPPPSRQAAIGVPSHMIPLTVIATLDVRARGFKLGAALATPALTATRSPSALITARRQCGRRKSALAPAPLNAAQMAKTT